MSKLEIHNTPTRGGWLNIAETELGILNRQCLDRCIANLRIPPGKIAAREWAMGSHTQSAELRDENIDGAVSVISAAPPGADTFRSFERNHSEQISRPGEQRKESAVFRRVIDALGWQHGAQP